MKKSTFIFIIIFTLLVGAFLGIWGQSALIGTLFRTSQPVTKTKFDWTIDLIESRYVDDISRDSLLNLAVPHIISLLDPHSEYIEPQDLGAVNESIEGKFDGIGVVFNMATDTVIVLSVPAGGPGYKAGIEPGDRILEVNDTIIAGKKLDQMKVVGKLRGERGTKIRLGVQRGGSDKLLTFNLVRGVIPINSIEAELLTRDSSAYVRISNFAEHTYHDAIKAIDKLVKRGAKSVVIDLRGNGGGLLDQALMLANEFLPEGQAIVYVEGAHFTRREQKADGRGAFQDIPLYVLIDESTASASEIFAGAMQDNDRATILGRRSFGKGLVQEQVGYSDGSAARITIARYYTPLGRPLQKPYTKGDKAGYDAELMERFRGDELTTGVNIDADSSVTYTTKGGKVLLGGGGITPDIFTPVDTTKLPEYFLELYQKNAIFPYAQLFADANRKEINAIDDEAALEAFFTNRPLLYDEFIGYATANHSTATPLPLAQSEAEFLVMSQLRAYISRHSPLQESGFYYYVQPVDNVTEQLSKLIKEESK